MKNLFSALGFSTSLDLDEAAIETAWRERTREFSLSSESSEPSEDRNETVLAELHEARSVLLDPVERLAHWLELSQVETSRAAVMDSDLMELFGLLGETISGTDEFLSRHQATSSAIGRALLAKEAISVQLGLQERMQAIQNMKAEAVSSFPSLEKGGKAGDYSRAVSIWQRLRFLAKWESQCQERLLSLLDC